MSAEIPLWLFIELSKVVSGSSAENNKLIQKLERKISAYEDGERGIPIRGRFPLAVTPEFDSLVAHFLGDGSFGGYAQSASYKQKNACARAKFIEQVIHVFGEFAVNKKMCERYWMVRIPKPARDVIRNFCNITETKTLTRRLPIEILDKPRQFRVAALSAFLVDEGYIGESIEMSVGNRLLLTDFRKLAVSLGYSCSPIISKAGHKTANPMFRFRISLRSAKRLLRDVLELGERFPACDLAHKQLELESIVRRQRRGGQKTRDGQTKQKILVLVKGKKVTISWLSKKLCLSRSTLREHLNSLE
ncbi:MAG: hypothetical protein AB1626_00690 [Candidatus Micrarchaeota archaeon]